MTIDREFMNIDKLDYGYRKLWILVFPGNDKRRNKKRKMRISKVIRLDRAIF